MPDFFECCDVVLKKFSVLLQCFHPGGLVTGRLFTVLLGQYVPVRCTSTFCMLQANFVKINLRHAASVLVLDMHSGIFLFPKITGYLSCRKAALVIAKCSFWNKWREKTKGQLADEVHLENSCMCALNVRTLVEHIYLYACIIGTACNGDQAFFPDLESVSTSREESKLRMLFETMLVFRTLHLFEALGCTHTSMNEFARMSLYAFVRTHNSRNAMCLSTLVQIENIIHMAFARMILFATACNGE